jgi:hypothetical protein
MNGVICYLLINKIPKLPRLAIESALQNTDSDIYVGYLNKSDLSDLPINSRIHFIELKEQALKKNLVPKTSGYVSFDKDFFFQLVQLKWDLFQSVLSESDADFLVYLDLDVVVLRNLVSEFASAFLSMPRVDILVQDFTHTPSVPRLCMGVFALRKNRSAVEFLNSCSAIHTENLSVNLRFGDDDVITKVYRETGVFDSFFLLPQQSFPVGNLFNLFLPFGALRGLRPEMPFVFHANFVVGSQKKRLLLYLVKFLCKKENFLDVIREYLVLFGFAFYRIPIRVLKRLKDKFN